jgi:hypothetical protein
MSGDTEISLDGSFKGAFQLLDIPTLSKRLEIFHYSSDQMIVVVSKFVFFSPNVV